MENEYELIVSQPKNPLWKIILSVLFYTFAFYAIAMIVFQPHFSNLTEEEAAAFHKHIIIFMICFAGGVYSSVRATILIDTDKEKLVTKYFLGFFHIKTTAEIPKLQYVAITVNSEQTYFINLWYADNKHYNMCYSDDKKKAYEFGEMVAKKLNIDLLDTSVKGESNWVDKATL